MMLTSEDTILHIKSIAKTSVTPSSGQVYLFRSITAMKASLVSARTSM